MSNAQDPRPFTGRHMFLIMLGFFATVLAANMTMVYFANHSWTGLVVKNSYVASQEFNATTEKMLANAALDIHPDVTYAAGTLRLTLRTSAGAPVAADNVMATLGRPSHEGEDRMVELANMGAGTYEAPNNFAAGQWTGTVSAEVPGFGQWSRTIRLMVRP